MQRRKHNHNYELLKNYFKMWFFYYPSQVSVMDFKRNMASNNTQTPLWKYENIANKIKQAMYDSKSSMSKP